MATAILHAIRALHRLAVQPLLRLRLLTLALAVWATVPLSAEPIGRPVSPGVWRLRGADPGLPLGDLEPLRQLIGDARVVGLGETIHTSGGYSRMKHRIFRFLVERMGFRVLAFESNWEPAEQVARFVATCEGDPRKAVEEGLFGFWASQEVLDLAQWMCDWNRTHPDPADHLHFAGFDIQQPGWDGPALTAFLQRIGIPEEDPRSFGVRRCERPEVIEEFTFADGTPYDPMTCPEALTLVEDHFTRNAAEIIRQTSKEDLEWAKIRVAGLRTWFGKEWSRMGPAYSVRDEGMAYVFHALRALRFPDAKVAVWAHNSHVSRAPHPVHQGRPMGSLLSQALGRGYVNLGLVAYETAIDWPRHGCGPIGLDSNSVEQRLHDLGQGDLLIDLRLIGRRLPSGTYKLGNRVMDPRMHFDGLIYLERSPRMTPLAWAPCQEEKVGR